MNKLFSVQTDIELPDHSGTMIRMLSYYRDSHSLNYKLKSLQELKGWNIRPDGIIPLDQKDVAVKMYYTNCLTREVPHWCQPLMSASSQGRIILLTRENNDGSEFLLTMRREAGIEGGYLMDVSDINYPGEDYTDHLEPQQVILHEFIQCDEGGRFYQHESIYRVILTDRSIEITDKQVWVSLSDLKYILGMSNVASIQLRCIASLFIMQMNKLLEK